VTRHAAIAGADLHTEFFAQVPGSMGNDVPAPFASAAW
jgi:hypothetical protein